MQRSVPWVKSWCRSLDQALFKESQNDRSATVQFTDATFITHHRHVVLLSVPGVSPYS